MRVFLPMLFTYAACYIAIAVRVKSLTTKLAVFAAILSSIVAVAIAAASLLIDQGYVWTQFVLPILAVFGLLGLYKIATMMAANLNKGK
jgi:hypothetical protein